MGSKEQRARFFRRFWGTSLFVQEEEADAWRILSVILMLGDWKMTNPDFPERIMTYLYAKTSSRDSPIKQNPHYDLILTWLRTYGQAVYKKWQTDAPNAPTSLEFELNLKKIFQNMSHSFTGEHLDRIEEPIWPWFVRVLHLFEPSPDMPTIRALRKASEG